eukprot:6187329-Pleurochrysis_carterae.AAC.1
MARYPEHLLTHSASHPVRIFSCMFRSLVCSSGKNTKAHTHDSHATRQRPRVAAGSRLGRRHRSLETASKYRIAFINGTYSDKLLLRFIT